MASARDHCQAPGVSSGGAMVGHAYDTSMMVMPIRGPGYMCPGCCKGMAAREEQQQLEHAAAACFYHGNSSQSIRYGDAWPCRHRSIL
jgi:hypothetical protein